MINGQYQKNVTLKTIQKYTTFCLNTFWNVSKQIMQIYNQHDSHFFDGKLRFKI